MRKISFVDTDGFSIKVSKKGKPDILVGMYKKHKDAENEISNIEEKAPHLNFKIILWNLKNYKKYSHIEDKSWFDKDVFWH